MFAITLLVLALFGQEQGPPAVEEPRIGVGDSVTAHLEATDQPLPGHGPSKRLIFYPTSDGVVTISLESHDFDAFLRVENADGETVAEDDASGIETNARRILARDLSLLTQLVARSVEIKAEVVSQDEREGGVRAILNAGHTIGHGLEHQSNYLLPHGEAVSLGLIAETRIAERMGLTLPGTADRVVAVLKALGLPTRSAPIAVSQVLEAMRHDKKNRDGAVRMSLPLRLGAMHQDGGDWTVPVTDDLLAAALDSLT